MADPRPKRLCVASIREALEENSDVLSDISISEGESDMSDIDDLRGNSDRDTGDSSSDEEARPRPRNELSTKVWKKWSEVDTNVCIRPTFTGEAGVRVELPENVSALQCFELFLSDDVVDMIVIETNRYANHFLDSARIDPSPQSSRILDWEDTNAKEVRAYFALILLMGVIHKPELTMYWSLDPILSTPIFNKTMSLRRFQLLCRHLHFVDNDQLDMNDRLKKIRPVIDMLRKTCRNVYMPSQNIAVDESLMLFKGRLIMRQYNPKKRARFGLKLFFVCESESGYAWDFFMYTAQGEEQREGIPPQPVSRASVTKLVMCPEMIGKGYIVFMDNWFSSPELFDELYDHGFSACGTVNLRRKQMPKELKQTKLKKGETVSYVSGNLSAIKWHDKKDVSMLTNIHKGTMGNSNKTNRVTGELIRKPDAVLEYNKCMGGVDKLDQMIKPYECLRKTVRWYKKLFFHLLDIMMVNSHVLYQQKQGKKTLLNFRNDVIRSLLEQNVTVRKSTKGGRPSTTRPPSRLTERHFATHIPPTPKKNIPTRVCRACPGRSETRWECIPCGNVPLHVKGCLENYHTHKKI